MPLHRERLILSRLQLDLVRSAAKSYFNPVGEGLGDIRSYAIGLAVLIGMAEGQPMTAHKIAQYLGIPRASVTRKLKTLVAQGVLEMDERGAATWSLPAVSTPEAIAGTMRRVELVLRAAEQLNTGVSKMDT